MALLSALLGALPALAVVPTCLREALDGLACPTHDGLATGSTGPGAPDVLYSSRLPRRAALALLLAACSATPGHPGGTASKSPDASGGDGATDSGHSDGADGSADGGEGGTEAPEPEDEPLTTLGDGPSIFTDTAVHEFGIELDEEAIAALAVAPTEYVEGAFIYGEHRYEPVGIRLKGNSTYQWLDGRPAWKVRFDEYSPELRFYGLKRVTLDSNYWDGSMMAETLAYQIWRMAGNPAPRTGYANVSFNGELYGLYTIVESMDDDYIDAAFPDTNGALWEMCRSCDFNLDCSAYPLQEESEDADTSGLSRACAAAATGEEAQIRAHFDWTRLTRHFALERVVNHSDSYGYNRNNYYVYHDPVADQLSLSPWGADSTFSYSYPPDEDRPCEPGYFDNLHADPGAYLAVWCRGNPACWADVKAEMSALADLIEVEDLSGVAASTADRISGSVAADPRWPWGYETFEEKSACFEQWLLDRPAQVRDYVATH